MYELWHLFLGRHRILISRVKNKDCLYHAWRLRPLNTLFTALLLTETLSKRLNSKKLHTLFETLKTTVVQEEYMRSSPCPSTLGPKLTPWRYVNVVITFFKGQSVLEPNGLHSRSLSWFPYSLKRQSPYLPPPKKKKNRAPCAL